VLRFVGGALVRDGLWADIDSVLITGPGAAELADLAADAGIGAGFRVTGDRATDLVGLSERLHEDDGAAADLVIVAFALGHRTDGEARQLLADLRERSET